MPYQYYYQPNRGVEDMPSLRSCLIVVIFIALVGDFSWLKDVQPPKMCPGCPAYEACMKEYNETIDSFESTIKTGKITPEQGAQYHAKIWSLRTKLHLSWNNKLDEDVGRKTREIFIRDWQPTAADTPDWIRVKIHSDYDRQQYAGMYFDSIWIGLQETARMKYENLKPATAAQVRAAAKIVVFWTVKWYFLLTCPAFLIVLLNKRKVGGSVGEELILQPYRWLSACLGGPIGLACISETADKVILFRQFKRQYLLAHPDTMGILSRTVKTAIWRQVEQPRLSFDEALASLKYYKAVHRPALACLLLWLMSIHQVPAAIKSVTAPVAVYLATALENKDCGDEAGNGGHHPLLLAVMSQKVEVVILQETVEICRADRAEAKSEIRLTGSPRGPPSAVKVQSRAMSLSLDCTIQKG